MLKEKVSSVVIYHLLLTFSQLSTVKEKLAGPFEETKFSDKMADFHEFYAQVNPNGKDEFHNYNRLKRNWEAGYFEPLHDFASATTSKGWT